MNRIIVFILALTILSCQESNQDNNNNKKNSAETIVSHKLNVSIDPEKSFISVVDTIIIDELNSFEFFLNSGLQPICLSEGIELTKISDHAQASDIGMDRDGEETEAEINLTSWKIEGVSKEVILTYSGNINVSMENDEADYQRGFSQTSGIINGLGTYLAGSTYWTPTIENSLVTYELTTKLPKTWKNVSQGERTFSEINEDSHIDTWKCNKPQEEIFLIAAEFTEYVQEMNSGVKAMAFLRTPDEGLANKYLGVTEQYMVMYEEMLGAYPYSKFALVENFWETGYGMPSFTLLGEQIIRFPFILHSSYPHELLHNWWGNSVYVDFESGNWCEGITAFMADHLIKEQRGSAEEYRRSTLQKYSNLVDSDSDFPLNEFQSRHDGPTEAIGYGKALMVWQMLRRKIGDKNFVQGVRYFNEDNKYKTASYDDIRIAMEKAAEEDLKPFFSQWITRKGAPEIAVKSIENKTVSGKNRIKITIEQKQETKAFDIDLPIHILTDNGVESFIYQMNQKEQEFQINLNATPRKLVVDPQYDVFRILHPSEVPPTLSKIWGSKDNILVLPSNTKGTQKEIYTQFANDWKAADNDNFEIVFDNEISELPKEKTAWILGYNNKFTKGIDSQIKNYNSSIIGESNITFEGTEYSKKESSFICTFVNPKDINRQNIFIAFDNEKAIAGLIRKLPHYGKYSYLGFEGDEPTNMAKGQWPVLNSPMVKIFDESAQKESVDEHRKALAELLPIFSEKKMLQSVEYLASKEMKGRGIGTPELDLAANYIAEKFEDAGLKPIDEDYFQNFTHTFPKKGKMKLTNVIGMIPGTDPKLKDFPVVISAHYDHLGMGWPDVHPGDEGKIHYGADDNASGTATIIELARGMAKTMKPKRSIIFLACTAEEAGLIGSRYFVEHSKDYFEGEIFANVNIDTDGSLYDGEILVLNGNSATEWVHIFNGFSYTIGIKAKVVNQSLDASDQVAFIEKGIPGIQLFTGATEHYHRPSDTFETVDGKGMVKVATLTQGVLEYLADREDPMHFVNATGQSEDKVSNEPKKDRKASTGTVPDFAFEGKGVKVGSVTKGSTGEKAGLLKGDIIIAFDGEKVIGLKQYSDLLKQYKPDQKVLITVLRGGEEIEMELVLGAR